MYDKELKELEIISQAVGNSPDLVQGGGGNTSVKLSDTLMAVKASGYKLSQITPTEGYVVLNYKDIISYYDAVDFSSGIDYEKDSTEFAKKSIVKMEGLKELRPSVEAGFHSALKKYVIHTHPVYANILCCSRNGEELAGKIFGSRDYDFIWIPYINPGFSLSLKIKESVRKHMESGRRFPEVIFMENHGLIVSSDDHERCIALHAEVNGSIREYLGIKAAYPELGLEKVDEGTFRSTTQYLAGFFKGSGITQEFFNNIALYPDQLVYLNGNISLNETANKLNINTVTGEIIYKTNYQEALTMEETLLGFVYVADKVRECGLPLKTMSAQDTDFINNWESEKYRKSLVNNTGK